jgi:hypothetical protein
LNNIGEITFDRSQGSVGFVIHTVRWKKADSAEFMWATYRVYMNPDDAVVFRDVKADNE